LYKRLVLQGGGVKGIALVGSLKALEEHDVRFEVIVGASAGAIVGSLVAAGYSAAELREILMDLDFSKFLDGSLNRLLLLRKFGMHTGNQLRIWIADLLKRKGIVKFSDFNARKVKLVIVATNITERKQIVFSHETPDVAVADAVRMSLSIPFFFDPVVDRFSFIIDGGVLSNFPLAQLPSTGDPSTIGLQLVSSSPPVSEKPSGLLEYIKQLVNTLTDAHDLAELQIRNVDVIKIDDGGVRTTDFALTSEVKQRLYMNGYQACSTFINKRKGLHITRFMVSAPEKTLHYEWPKGFDEDNFPYVRCSMSGLVRIVSDNYYLLVKGQRIEQFQPVGGVFKYTKSSRKLLESLGATDDQKIAIDDDSRDDLRVYIPKHRLSEFLKWYLSAIGREVSPDREFREEVTGPGLFDPSIFASLELEWSRTHVCGIRWSPHFKCYELLVAEIFNFCPNSMQEEAFRESRARLSVQQNGNNMLAWVTAEQIETRGWRDHVARQPLCISEHSAWLLQQIEN
jgi:NTE family protein